MQALGLLFWRHVLALSETLSRYFSLTVNVSTGFRVRLHSLNYHSYSRYYLLRWGIDVKISDAEVQHKFISDAELHTHLWRK